MAQVKNRLLKALEQIDTASLVDELIARLSEAPQGLDQRYAKQLALLLVTDE